MSAAILLRGCNAYIRTLTISHNTPCLTPQKYAEPWFLLSLALGHHSLPKINWGQYLSVFSLGGGGEGGQTSCILGDVQMAYLQAFSNTPLQSSKKWGQVHNLSHGNEFYLHWNEKSFRYQTLSTSPRFDAEAQENSEMAYSRARNFSRHVNVHQYVQTLREGEGRLWTKRLGTPRQAGCILKDQN